MSNEEETDYLPIVVVILAILIMSGGLFLVKNYADNDMNKKDAICKSLDLGFYDRKLTSDTEKTIDNVQYFKCTKNIYNSTTKEIITSEKWVKLP